MTLLRIEFFGDFRLFRGNMPLPGFPTLSAKSLFSYLVMHRNRLHDRDVLAGTFWGDRPQTEARKSLRTNLWRVRQAIADDSATGQHALLVSDRQIGFNADAEYSLDVEQFERHLALAAPLATATARDESHAHLEHAVALYRGNLLEGVYDEWCVREQARLHALFLHALETLMFGAAARGELRAGLAHGERLLTHDVLRETTHREVMRLHYRVGDRAAAVRQYRQCVRVLDEELGVPPMQETTALYQAIVEDRALAPALTVAHDGRDASGAVAVLRDAAEQLERVASSIRRSISAMDAGASTPSGAKRS